MNIKYIAIDLIWRLHDILNEYKDIFPAIIKIGVQKVPMDLFGGEKRIAGEVTFLPVLVDAIRKYQ